MNTSEINSILKQLTSVPALSGYESRLHETLNTLWKPYLDEISISRVGSYHALRLGQASQPRPRLLLTAHMDTIGLMVSGIQDGFLRLTEIGGIDARLLPGQLVTVHGKQLIPAVIVQPPPFLLPKEYQSNPVPLQYLWADCGLSAEKVNQQIHIGDIVTFDQPFIELDNDLVSSPGLDNRASLTAITVCIQELAQRQPLWDSWFVASVQEEETQVGALTSAFQIQPNLAIVVDVTFANGPGSPPHKTFPLGKGITLGWGATVHPYLYQSFKDLADQLEIPYKPEPMPRRSGTDADSLQTVAHGIPTMVIGIPLRYMHSAVEIISLKDIQRTARLLTEFIARLEVDFLDKIKWDETN